jgi:RNAse (barnase) inhibitor barstar
MHLVSLLGPDAHWLHVATADPAEVADAVAALNRYPGTVARVLRGPKMRTAAGLFDEFAAALQFPAYFGENWDALDECLTDLSWLPAQRYLIAITTAPEVLSRASPADRHKFWELLKRVAGEQGGTASGHSAGPPRVFRVVAQGPAEELSRLPVAGKPMPGTAGSE